MVLARARTGYRAPAPLDVRVGAPELPLLPGVGRAVTLRTRVLVGTILSAVIVGGALLLPAPGRASGDHASPLAADEAVPVRVAVAEGVPAPAAANASDGADGGSSAPAPKATRVDASYVRAASTCPGLDPAVLAAIHTIETQRGSDRRISTAGAVGPMQFLPATWQHYGIDGNGDGRADIRNFSDAVFSAARLLCANGGADRHRLPTAVWNYNHSHAYVSTVLRLAERLSAT